MSTASRIMKDKISKAQELELLRVTRSAADSARDWVAIEAPLEIGLSYDDAGQRVTQIISITMRTPGDDAELAVGYLYSEGIFQALDEVQTTSSPRENRVDVTLVPSMRPDVTRLQRSFYTTSSCGVCGKASIEALRTIGAERLPLDHIRIRAATLRSLPGALAASQAVFEQTGGLHAAAIFNFQGHLLRIREDVGRHNALDKLIGVCLRERTLPHAERILLLSGRISFELVQKAVRARIPVVAAIGAPSSLAIELAAEYNITTVGFLNEDRFNCYSGSERIER